VGHVELWDHTPAELGTLPIPDLALLVLADFQQRGGWNARNWHRENEQWHEEHLRTPGLENRLAEAWAWLEAHALVAARFDQSSPDARQVTSEGRRALELGLARLHAAVRLEGELLPELEKARRQFLQGDYEEAVFAAFRTVEETVRRQASADLSDLGVKLMRRAFKPHGGPLTDPEAEVGEQDAMSNLFAGAIGVFKNPSSHRTVSYDDPTIAAQAVLFADLLLRIMARRGD